MSVLCDNGHFSWHSVCTCCFHQQSSLAAVQPQCRTFCTRTLRTKIFSIIMFNICLNKFLSGCVVCLIKNMGTKCPRLGTKCPGTKFLVWNVRVQIVRVRNVRTPFNPKPMFTFNCSGTSTAVVSQQDSLGCVSYSTLIFL